MMHGQKNIKLVRHRSNYSDCSRLRSVKTHHFIVNM